VNILSAEIVQDINNEVGSASMPESQKRISEEESTELCELLLQLAVVSKTFGDEQPPVLEESYASDRGGELSQPETDTMTENWIGIEDDPGIQELEIEEVLNKLEVGKEEDTDDDARG
jgi:hypothetical protein